MGIDNVAACFETIAARSPEPRLVHDVGTWQIDVDDVATWSIQVDHGALKVKPGPDPRSTVRIRLSEAEFLRLARGDAHENAITALLRGALEVHGDIAFAQKLQALLPITEREAPAQRGSR